MGALTPYWFEPGAKLQAANAGRRAIKARESGCALHGFPKYVTRQIGLQATPEGWREEVKHSGSVSRRHSALPVA